MAEMRSRGGCANCRKRRRKCSENRPRCKSCVQRNVSCEYPVRLQWAAVTASSVAAPEVRPSRARCPVQDTIEVATPAAASTASERLAGPSRRGRVEESPERVVFGVQPSSENTGFIRNAAAHVSPHHRSDSQSGGSIHSPQSLPSQGGSSQSATPEIRGGAGGTTAIAVFEDAGIVDGWDFNDSDFFGGLSPDLFGDAGERIAFSYWLNYLAGILPALDSAVNPYRKLSSLALASPVLLDTIISLATEYMYCHGRASPELVMKRHDKAIGSLRTLLASCQTAPAFSGGGGGGGGDVAAGDEQQQQQQQQKDLSPKQATLAAVLLQIANLVFIGGSGIDVHLACAMHFLHDLDYVKRAVHDFIPRLLIQRFAFIDVTTAILRRRRPHLPPNFWLFVPDEHYDRTVPSFREMTGCPQPLLGFFSRVAHLAADLDDGVRNEHAVLRSASTLETDMRIYARSRVTFRTTRPTKSQHLDSLSQCFYWSAHLLLQRQVYRDPANSARVQHTIDDLVMLIKSMPPGCGPDSALPFPFYLSSRDAVTEKHRAWVRQRNIELKHVYPSRTRDSMMASMEQIWAALDDKRLEREALDKDADAVIRRLEQAHDFCLF